MASLLTAAASLLLIVTTVGTRADAVRLARTLVERGLAACAQITEIESFFAWQNAVRNETEFRIDFKVTAAAYAAAAAAIRGLHPYELPAIHAVAVERADPSYVAWVEANSQPSVAP